MITRSTRPALVTTVAVVAAIALATVATSANAATLPVTPRCGNASLAVTRTFVDSGAGHSWLELIYRNAGGHSCTVTGYPGLDAVTGTGHVLAHATRTVSGYGDGASGVHTVTIRPGGFASAGVGWLNFNVRTGGACRFSAGVITIVANTTRVHRLAVSVSACGLQVHPTVPGTGLYPHYGPAQRDWIVGSTVDAAGMNYYFLNAEHQLKLAKIYPTQVKELAQLASLPDTGLTNHQIKEAHADVRSLNRFFGTPGLYF